jgi:hypothetical protein
MAGRMHGQHRPGALEKSLAQGKRGREHQPFRQPGRSAQAILHCGDVQAIRGQQEIEPAFVHDPHLRRAGTEREKRQAMTITGNYFLRIDFFQEGHAEFIRQRTANARFIHQARCKELLEKCHAVDTRLRCDVRAGEIGQIQAIENGCPVVEFGKTQNGFQFLAKRPIVGERPSHNKCGSVADLPLRRREQRRCIR